MIKLRGAEERKFWYWINSGKGKNISLGMKMMGNVYRMKKAR